MSLIHGKSRINVIQGVPKVEHVRYRFSEKAIISTTNLDFFRRTIESDKFLLSSNSLTYNICNSISCTREELVT